MRPAPILTEDNQAYWDGAADGRIVAQQCRRCARLYHPPRAMCPRCHSVELGAVELSGNGTVYSFSVLHHPQLPLFDYPVIAVLVDLEEGVRVLSNLVGVEPDALRVGLPVRARFEPTADDLAVPVFELRSEER